MWPLMRIGEKEVCGVEKKKRAKGRSRIINRVEMSAACRGNAGEGAVTGPGGRSRRMHTSSGNVPFRSSWFLEGLCPCREELAFPVSDVGGCIQQ